MGGGGGGGRVEPVLTTAKRVFVSCCNLFSVQRLEELEEIDCWKKVYDNTYIFLELVKEIFCILLIIGRF
jgi:hypothetical protein